MSILTKAKERMTTLLISIGVFFGIIIIFGFILPHVAWSLRYLFEPINFLHWWMLNPTRPFFNQFEFSSGLRKTAVWSFRILYLFRIIYYVIFWILFAPLRIISSFYYNIILFYSLSIKDNVLDWMGVGANTNLNTYKVGPFFLWIKLFFSKLPGFGIRLAKIIFQGFAMFILDSVIPALTVYHGTSKMALDSIVRDGKWIAGNGDFGGIGIYFGIRKGVAQHYGRWNGTNARIIIARVSIPLIRSLCTIPEKIKISKEKYATIHYPLKGGDGLLISNFLSNKLSNLIELYRHPETFKGRNIKKGWYELCVVTGKQGVPISTWRVRPIGELLSDGERLGRIHRGINFWPMTIQDWIFLLLSFSTFYLVLLGSSQAWMYILSF